VLSTVEVRAEQLSLGATGIAIKVDDFEAETGLRDKAQENNEDADITVECRTSKTDHMPRVR
jgi:hypothetical protein